MEDQTVLEPIEKYLPRNIELTRKARIEAERRLLANDALVRHTNIYYACLTATLTLLSVFSDADYLPFLSVASAVVLSITTIYASSQNYVSRALQMKLCYTRLQELSFEVDSLDKTNPSELSKQLSIIGKKYIETLKNTENHLPKDHQKACDQKTVGINGKQTSGYLAIRAAVIFGPLVLFFLLFLVFQVQ